jgi:plasmid stabilization system protein ParE
MKYRIELAATAKADIRQQAQWLRDQASPAAAERWLAGLYKAIDTLQTRPQRCPVAAENDKFPEEIRELPRSAQMRQCRKPSETAGWPHFQPRRSHSARATDSACSAEMSGAGIRRSPRIRCSTRRTSVAGQLLPYYQGIRVPTGARGA